MKRRTRQEAIADYIAAKVMANTQKHFSTLYEEALKQTAKAYPKK